MGFHCRFRALKWHHSIQSILVDSVHINRCRSHLRFIFEKRLPGEYFTVFYVWSLFLWQLIDTFSCLCLWQMFVLSFSDVSRIDCSWSKLNANEICFHHSSLICFLCLLEWCWLYVVSQFVWTEFNVQNKHYVWSERDRSNKARYDCSLGRNTVWTRVAPSCSFCRRADNVLTREDDICLTHLRAQGNSNKHFDFKAIRSSRARLWFSTGSDIFCWASIATIWKAFINVIGIDIDMLLDIISLGRSSWMMDCCLLSPYLLHKHMCIEERVRHSLSDKSYLRHHQAVLSDRSISLPLSHLVWSLERALASHSIFMLNSFDIATYLSISV